MKEFSLRKLLSFFILNLFCAMSSAAYDRIAPPLFEQVGTEVMHHSAEVLLSKHQSFIDSDYHWKRVSYFSIRLNDLDAARDYGRISIPFNHYYSNTQLDFANVLASDGSMSPVSEDAIQLRVTGGGQDFYSDSSEIVFSLPDITVGSVIEFQFTKTSKKIPVSEFFSENMTPYWFQRTVGGRNWRVDFVAQHDFEFSHPKNIAVHSKSFKNYPDKPKTQKSQSTQTLSWNVRNVEGVKSEGWMPELRKVLPGMIVSTNKDWQVISRWTWENIKEKVKPTESLKKIVAGFQLDDNATSEEKIRAVYAYIQSNIRYVFAHLGRGGYEPHFADDVLEASYGDCKDQTVLAVALLNILGVDARAALVETPRSGRHDTELVQLIFDHMIVFIPGDDNRPPMWMDTTGDRSLYPGVSSFLRGQNVLVVGEEPSQLTQIRDGLYENSAELALTYTEDAEQRTVVDAEIQVAGYFEENLRSWWIYAEDRESALNKYVKSIFPNTTDYELQAEFKHASDLWQPVRISAQFLFPSTSESEEAQLYGASFNQVFRLFNPLSSLQEPQTRSHAFVDNSSYTLKFNAQLTGEEKVFPTVVQSSGNLKSASATLTQAGSRNGSDYALNAVFHRPELNLTVAGYEQYYEALEQISLLKPWLISMQPDVDLAEKEQLERLKDSEGPESFSYLLALAKEQVSSGRYQAALNNAKKAVELDSGNGEAWYMLGMSQGFNALIDESNTSFERAASLGYLP